ncbi:MAG: hypothetical protein ACW981_05335 [Candidatus Hodarchaeales archaeon]|jgi:hypothetical protein
MEMVLLPILIIFLVMFILLIIFGLNRSHNTAKESINPGIMAGVIIFILFLGLFLFFIFGISSSGSFNIAPFIPIFAGSWIPIWIVISAQKKKESKITTGSPITNEFTSQRDEVKSIRFCPSCGGQYNPADRYCEMCGQSL